MTPEEKAVIDVALALVTGVRAGIDPVSLDNDLEAAVDALIFACPQCNAGGHTCPGDGNPIGHAQTDCGEHEEERCRCSRTERVYCHVENCHGGANVQEWAPATLSLCLAGDHIRIDQDETDVIRTDGGREWHADNTDPYRPRHWKHIELRMELAANPGFQEYPPNTPCEILCTPERKASLLLQSGFTGSAVISSDVD